MKALFAIIWFATFVLMLAAVSSLISLAVHYLVCGNPTFATIALTGAAFVSTRLYKFYSETFQ